MAIKIPHDKVDLIRRRVYEELDKAKYLASSRTDNAILLENLCANPNIGGIVGLYYPKERIRTYIKDAVINRYAKEHKRTQRPAFEKQIEFCSKKYLVGTFLPLNSGDKKVILMKAAESPIFVVIVEGTLLKWESALRTGLLFVASRPIGANPQSIVHIVLSLFIGGVSVTPSDKKLLAKALARAGADVYMWGA
jgi:hypothetical protein